MEDTTFVQSSLKPKSVSKPCLEPPVSNKSNIKSSLVNYISRKFCCYLRNTKGLCPLLCHYIVSHTNLTSSEVEAFYEQFLKFHPSGTIDIASFRRTLQESQPGADITGLAEHLWRIYDTNMDGKVDFGEFMLALCVMMSGSAEENLKQIFRLFDVNSDGKVEFEELDKVVLELRKLGEVGDEMVERAFTEMDLNMDGSVTQEEFVEACLQQREASVAIALRVINIFVSG